MWEVNGENLKMIEGDFGFELPFTFNDIIISPQDNIKLEIKKEKDADPILTFDFSDIQNNEIKLVLTKADSEKLNVGNYLYVIDWYQGESFLGNIVNGALFKVVNKA